MSEDKLMADVRTEKGKNAMRRMRSAGRIPGNFYGSNYDTISVSFNEIAFRNAVAKRKSLYTLVIEGKGEFEVIVREIQRDPVSERIQHVDLLGITRGQKITATIPLKYEGIPEGVRVGGGILEVIRRKVDVEALPKHLPEYIIVDVTNLEIGESIHVADVRTEDVNILLTDKMTIVTVVPPAIFKTAAEELEEAEAEAAEAAEAEEGEEGESEESAK